MNKPQSTNGKVERAARLHWVRLGDMHIPPMAQRTKLNQSRVDHIVADLDLEQIGAPTVNERAGKFYIIDGWHRTEALRQYGFTEDDKIQCWAYSDLSEQDEAERFLKLNDTLAVDALSKFRASVHAERAVECDIDRIVRAQGLIVTRDKIDGAIGAVGTLIRIYHRNGPAVLSRTLRIIRDAYGTPGLDAAVLDGIAYLCGRYNGDLDDEVVIDRLNKTLGGVSGLLNRANQLRLNTGKPRGHCVAAAAVDITNAGRGGKKLPSWWREDVA